MTRSARSHVAKKATSKAPGAEAAGSLLFELVLPAYNEGASLAPLVARAVAAAEAAGFTAKQARVVIVDNGSTDDTRAVLERLLHGKAGASLRVVHVAENQGYGHGLWAGLRSSQAPYVGWSHADEQCDPADAFAALARVVHANKRVLVKGQRRGRALQDRVVSRTFEACARLALGLDVDEINAQPKVVARELLTHFRAPPKDFSFDLYALYQARKQGYAIDSLEVRFAPRAHGVSRWAVGLTRRWRTMAGMLSSMAAIGRREGRLP